MTEAEAAIAAGLAQCVRARQFPLQDESEEQRRLRLEEIELLEGLRLQLPRSGRLDLLAVHSSERAWQV